MEDWLTKLIIGIVFILLVASIFFFPNGLYSKVKYWIHGKTVPDDTPLRGVVKTEEGIIFSPNMSIDVKDEFKVLIRGIHPKVEGEPCLMLIPVEYPDVYTVDAPWYSGGDSEYVIQFKAAQNKRRIELLDPAKRVRARIDDEGISPCIVARERQSRAFVQCLEKNLVNCGSEVFTAVDEVDIKGKSMEKITVPVMGEFDNKFYELDGRKYWLLYYSGVQVCFIPNGGNDEGNKNGVSKGVVEEYLKRSDRKVCT